METRKRVRRFMVLVVKVGGMLGVGGSLLWNDKQEEEAFVLSLMIDAYCRL